MLKGLYHDQVGLYHLILEYKDSSTYKKKNQSIQQHINSMKGENMIISIDAEKALRKFNTLS